MFAKRFLSSAARQYIRSNGVHTPRCAMPMSMMTSMHPFKNMTKPLVHFRSFSNQVETMEFRAETKQLLDIVTNSIYTDKEVFVRELISNASDALEKLRYQQVNGTIVNQEGDKKEPLEISIFADKNTATLTITDNGIGMSREDLVNNLGVIARSGSKQFVESLKAKGGAGNVDPHGIIGQFGVGFYSSFMVADKVVVESIPAITNDASGNATTPLCHRWSSDGSGVFNIETVSEPAPGHNHGTRITMHLKEKFVEYADPKIIKTVIQKYSNFVAFPIRLNEETVNTVSALWTKDKKEVTQQQYIDFYKFIGNAYDEPRYTLHYRTDAPIDLKVLFFIPSFHSEKFGGGHMERGVNLYSRKVLIESKPEDLLPNWLRFIKGVVDSEDLPLSISREKPQDSQLLRRIREVVTRKLVRFLEDQMKEDLSKYREFYMEYAYFLKEGVCSDAKFQESIAKLLMFESSSEKQLTLTSLDEYIARCPPEQKDIYYLVAPSRQAALASPYMETFKKHNKEVLLMYTNIDDFVMGNLKTYGGRKLVSAEQSDIKFDKDDDVNNTADDANKKDATTTSGEKTAKRLTEAEVTQVCGWLRLKLGETKVKEVKVTHRLNDSPAIVTDHESGALRKMIKMVEHANSTHIPALPPQTLEINPKHPIIISLFEAIQLAGQATTTTTTASSSSSVDSIPEAEVVDPVGEHVKEVDTIATLIAEQVYDNALIAAGLTDDPRAMLPRLNKILHAAINHK